mmetsp:Transcript_86623/g.245116  ORF Transcript_86623/g.245116 Transcript_86623/m.245116 type:complete len:97 (-) Transcript_86623:347-637(-)
MSCVIVESVVDQPVGVGGAAALSEEAAEEAAAAEEAGQADAFELADAFLGNFVRGGGAIFPVAEAAASSASRFRLSSEVDTLPTLPSLSASDRRFR